MKGRPEKRTVFVRVVAIAFALYFGAYLFIRLKSGSVTWGPPARTAPTTIVYFGLKQSEIGETSTGLGAAQDLRATELYHRNRRLRAIFAPLVWIDRGLTGVEM